MKTVVIILVFTVAICIGGIGVAISGEAILTWDYPTTNTDESALTDLSGFKVYYGMSSGSYSTTIDAAFATCVTAPPCSTSTYTVANLNNGPTYYFVVTAYDTTGNESANSNEVFKTITPSSSPIPAPTGIRLAWSGGTITVSWDKPNYSNIAGYQVSRGPTPTLFNALHDIGLAAPDSSPCIISYAGCSRRQYTMYRVSPGTYYFRVEAYDSSGNIGVASTDIVYVTVVADTTLPADVSGFTATPYSTGIRLSWTNPTDPDFCCLWLEYSYGNSTGPWITLANNLKGLPGGKQTYDHLSLLTGGHYYRIHTKDVSGNMTSTEYAGATLANKPAPETVSEPTPAPQTSPEPTQKRERASTGFGCGTIRHDGDGGGNDGNIDGGIIALAGLLLIWAMRAKLRLLPFRV